MKPLLKSLVTSPVIAALLFVIGCVMISASGLDAQVYRWSQTSGLKCDSRSEHQLGGRYVAVCGKRFRACNDGGACRGAR